MRKLLFTLSLLLFAASLAYGDKFLDKTNDAKGSAGKLSKLAELTKFEFEFHGPGYVKFQISTAGAFPEEADADLAYYIDFGVDPMAAANPEGSWKADMSLIYRPFDRENSFTQEGEADGLKFALVTAHKDGHKALLNLRSQGMKNDYLARMRLRSVLETEEGRATDYIDRMWFYPRITEKMGPEKRPPLPPKDQINFKEDELARLIVGLFEFSLGSERGLIDITRRDGKYYCTFMWYGGQITEAPLYILKINEPPRKRKGFTIESVDLAMKTHFGLPFRNPNPRPTIINFPEFNGSKCKTVVETDIVRFDRGEIYYSRDEFIFEAIRVDREPNDKPDRRAYFNRYLKERYIDNARDAYSATLSLFNCISSEDWTPGLELYRMGGFENKQYLARRMVRMSGMIDHFPDCDEAIRKRALQLRWRMYRHPAVEPVLKNKDVTKAVRLPILVYIFEETNAKLDQHYTMEAKFTRKEIRSIKRGLTRGSELLFEETFGYFTPVFDYYDEQEFAEELPPITRLGRGVYAVNPNEETANDYMLVMEMMLKYTIYPHQYKPTSDMLPPEQFRKKGFQYPIIFLIGKVDSKNFKNYSRTRSQSDPGFKDANVLSGVTFTKGIDRGHPGYCSITLDRGFQESDLLEIVHWATIMIMLDNTVQMKDKFNMEFLRDGNMRLLPDPYTPLPDYDAEYGTAEWWNVFLNVYWTGGLRKLFSFGRRPYYVEQVTRYPQILGETMRLGEHRRWKEQKDRIPKEVE
ncbi:MAG: hypothetical protein U5N86_04015 [Planctomycetota bacterium]|nr:hypothetical protein [Planctomycetota bacterium]